MQKTLSVAAIKNGTVIDHIPRGCALKILELLFKEAKSITSIGMYLPSETLGLKDILKIENRQIDEEKISLLAVLAPHCTVNLIENYRVIKKFQPTFPDVVEKIFSCPNLKCITRKEEVNTSFQIHAKKYFTCKYCERTYPLDKMKHD